MWGDTQEEAMNTKKNGWFVEFLGWYGMIAILIAYGLISIGTVTIDSTSYHLLNGSGGLGIIIVSFKRRAYQPAFLNIVFLTIAIVSLFRIFFL